MTKARRLTRKKNYMNIDAKVIKKNLSKSCELYIKWRTQHNKLGLFQGIRLD